MKKAVLSLIIFFLLVMGIPLWVFRGFSDAEDKVAGNSGPLIRVLDKNSGKVSSIPLEEYLVGVVAAEMPADFEPEALKAQAVAARTYTVKRMFMYGAKPVDEHKGAEICTDPTHCQAWSDTGQLREKWGAVKYYFYIEKIKMAVRQTEGEIITYNGTPIDPVYHGSCGGKGTENAEDVWSSPVPYLRGVDCSLEYKAQDQVYSRDFNRAELLAAVKQKAAASDAGSAGVKAAFSEWEDIIIPVEKTSTGRIKQARVLGYTVSGSKLREMLGMTSTDLTWEVHGDKVKFTSRGKGHAVGMCQYGANGMAKEGKDYRQIIQHYYSGVELEKLKY